MILNKFTKIHLRDKYQVLDIPLKSFITLEQSIQARGYVFTIFSTIIDSYTTCKYMHRSAICQQTMKMAPQIHPCISDCSNVKDWRGSYWSIQLERSSSSSRRTLSGIYQVISRHVGYQLSSLSIINYCTYTTLVQSFSLHYCFTWAFLATIVFEFAYTKPYEDFKADVKFLLEGSSGKITTAIPVNVNPRCDCKTKIQNR